MNLQYLQQENGTLLITKTVESTVKEMKMIQTLTLKQKLLNHSLVITQMHIFF